MLYCAQQRADPSFLAHLPISFTSLVGNHVSHPEQVLSSLVGDDLTPVGKVESTDPNTSLRVVSVKWLPSRVRG
jgi:hypothetical protein